MRATCFVLRGGCQYVTRNTMVIIILKQGSGSNTLCGLYVQLNETTMRFFDTAEPVVPNRRVVAAGTGQFRLF